MPVFQQLHILDKLYNSTGGENWTRKWPFSEINISNLKDEDIQVGGDYDPCTWVGIECREVVKQIVGDTDSFEKDYVITGINLKDNNLTGSIPSEIFLLPDLRRIILSSNYIQAIGLDASCISNTSNSVTMQSDKHKELTSSLMNMTSEVQNRVVENNEVQLSSTTIVELDLSKNNLTCYNPESLRQYLPNLEKLDFSMNNLGGTLPDFRMFQNLHTLNFASTGLEGSLPPSLLNTSRAKHSRDTTFTIDLISNAISGSIPPEFTEFFRLNLFLQNNKIQKIPFQICNQLEWMEGEVGLFGCDAILCPPNYFSLVGRQTSKDSICIDCKIQGDTNEFFGQLSCGNEKDSGDVEVEETIATWSRLANARFWGYFSLFVFALAGVFTFVGD